MLINEDKTDAKYQIKAYQPGAIRINENTYHRSLIVSANHLITDWPPQSIQEINKDDLQPILKLNPEIVLLGTGETFLIPTKQLLSVFENHDIGIEYMNTGAACRTYTALLAENRQVIAALLIK